MANHFPHLLHHLRPVTVDQALRACGLVFSVRASVQAGQGVIGKPLATLAIPIYLAMMISAEHGDHHLDGPLLPLDPTWGHDARRRHSPDVGQLPTLI